MSDSEVATDVETLVFEIGHGDAGERLDSFIAKHVSGWSRSRIQRLIEDGEVLVNSQTKKSSYKIRFGDRIDVELVEPAVTSFEPENIPIDVVFEDADLIVVNKPAGLVVHPGAGVMSGTLANGLAYHFQSLSKRGGAVRPGIVHRLDKDTSGLIVVAKSEDIHEQLSEQFRERTVYKCYAGLVHGVVKEDNGKIDQPVARDPARRIRMTVIRGGRPALTLYQVRRRFDRFTLLDVEIKTGRTHQIRVHMRWLKHPVVGDTLYGDGRDKSVPDSKIRAAILALNRPFLHAAKLAFVHPRTQQRLLFQSELPDDLRKFLDVLESNK